MKGALAIALLLVAQIAHPQELRLELPARVNISERTNVSIREDGRYAGLLSRQVNGYLTRTAGNEYGGRFFVYEQVRRDLRQIARPISTSIETITGITPRVLFEGDGAYPSYQNLLTLPEPSPAVGESWDEFAWVRIAPRPTDDPMRLPVIVRYVYRGIEPYGDGQAHRVEAQFATRYPLRATTDPTAPTVDYFGNIAGVQGSHRLTILLPVDGEQVAFMRDEFAEEYRFFDGSRILHEGHALLFLNGLSITLQRGIAERLRVETEDVTGVTVEQTNTGVRLRIEDLRFVADQAVLLPGEADRLDDIATALRGAPSSRFLIVGHTADVGTMESQDVLSVERARAIAAELASRGIGSDLMDIEGRGGREPIAPNAAEEGRAQNRRVEIFVVEP